MKESGVIKQMFELNYIQYKDNKEGKPTINIERSAGGRPWLVDESSLGSMVNDIMHLSCRFGSEFCKTLIPQEIMANFSRTML